MSDERDEWTPPERVTYGGMPAYRWKDDDGCPHMLALSPHGVVYLSSDGPTILTRPMAAWLAERLAEWAKGGEL